MNVRHAAEEQSLPFLVFNDGGLHTWKHIGCQIWPTVLVFGPDSLPIYIFEGENHVQHLELFLLPVLAYYKSGTPEVPLTPLSSKQSPEEASAIGAGKYVCFRDMSTLEVCVVFHSFEHEKVSISKSLMLNYERKTMYFICWFKSIDVL